VRLAFIDSVAVLLALQAATVRENDAPEPG